MKNTQRNPETQIIEDMERWLVLRAQKHGELAAYHQRMELAALDVRQNLAKLASPPTSGLEPWLRTYCETEEDFNKIYRS